MAKAAETKPKTDAELAEEDKKRQEARYNDPNKSDEDREKERRERLKLPPEETAEEKALRIAEEKKAERDKRETPDQRLAREAKESQAMREKGGTMIREIKSDQVSHDGEPVVSIRELVEPEGRGDQQPNQRENVKEKTNNKGDVKK